MISIETITYACAKYLADVLSPLVGKTEHHVNNSKEFTEYMKNLKVDPDEGIKKLQRVSSIYERTGQQGDGHHQEEIRRR